MRQDSWFETLSLSHQIATKVVDHEARRRFLLALTSLEKVLDGAAEGSRGFDSIPGLYGFYSVARLNVDERRRAEQLGARLWNATGSGRTFAEEALLGQVGVQASPDSLPFFRAALEANRERDSFQVRRRRIAVASVAFIARQTGDAASRAQLEAWLSHPDVTVRTEAAALYGRIHLTDAGTLEGAARTVLERVAYEERAFAPRFLARGWLHTAGVPVRVEPPEGVYSFKASLGRVSRTVELTSSESLGDLASAILNAFGWDHDHLYEFALTGDLRDRRFILPDMELEPSPMDLPLGAFGFTKGHKFIFRYDFGDDHRFQVTVADIHAHRSPRAKYPRVVDKTGRNPAQYPSLE